jgi:4-carboxymuconolactone decarboxylase
MDEQDQPRIAPVVDAPPSVPGSDRLGGRPLNLMLTLANHEPLVPAITTVGEAITGRTALLPVQVRELAILRTGWRTQSRYEVSQHLVMAAAAGLSDEKIAATMGDDLSSFSADEATILTAVDELCTSDRISAATWQALSGRWSDAEILEFLVVIGFYRLIAGVLNSAGVQVEPEIPLAW